MLNEINKRLNWNGGTMELIFTRIRQGFNLPFRFVSLQLTFLLLVSIAKCWHSICPSVSSVKHDYQLETWTVIIIELVKKKYRTQWYCVHKKSFPILTNDTILIEYYYCVKLIRVLFIHPKFSFPLQIIVIPSMDFPLLK